MIGNLLNRVFKSDGAEKEENGSFQGSSSGRLGQASCSSITLNHIARDIVLTALFKAKLPEVSERREVKQEQLK